MTSYIENKISIEKSNDIRETDREKRNIDERDREKNFYGENKWRTCIVHFVCVTTYYCIVHFVCVATVLDMMYLVIFYLVGL